MEPMSLSNYASYSSVDTVLSCHQESPGCGLKSISDEASLIIKIVGSISRDDFLDDRVLQRAVCMSLIYIGEKVKGLSNCFTCATNMPACS